MERRKQRSRSEWWRIIGEQEQSGLAVAAFCRREAIGVSSFYRWKGLLADEGGREVESEARSFIDMGQVGVPGDTAVAMSAAEASSLVVTLELGDGARLTLKRG
jgi:hypothetical protein